MENQNKEIITKIYASDNEKDLRKDFVNTFKECPIPENELLENLGLFIKRQDMARMLFLNELYKKIINTHGIIIEFGTRWGRNLSLFESLRSIYEPFNHNRKIVGFDTFEGFSKIHKKDGNADIAKAGAYSTTENYEEYLKKVLDYHEKEAPLSHIKKYEIIKGDAAVQIEKYLEDNPQTVVALAYFDVDVYHPTKRCLESIKGHLTKGSVVGFDELNHTDFPGETLAVKEVFGLDKYKIQRFPYSSIKSYVVIE